MTIEKVKGDIVFHCDLRGCDEGIETQESDFALARDKAKDEGWQFRNRDGVWKHFCGRTHEDMDYRGQWIEGKSLL